MQSKMTAIIAGTMLAIAGATLLVLTTITNIDNILPILTKSPTFGSEVIIDRAIRKEKK